MSFCNLLVESNQDLWDEMVEHPFLNEMRSECLKDERFQKWLRQDYEFVKAALPFVSAIKPKAPEKHLRPLAEAEVALHDELDLFEERARALGVSVESVPRNLVTHSYIQHLMATAYRTDYPVALTVYWTAEKAYHESWKTVLPSIDGDHKWYPFVENWAGEEFAEFVGFLGESVEEVAEEASDEQLRKMREQFRWTVRYEIAFWDMAFGRSGEEWLKLRT